MPGDSTQTVDSSAVRRILLIRPRFLGDICLTLPSLDSARAACPHARVAYVVERESAPLLEGDPRVDELMVVPRGPNAGETARLIARLRAFRPDVAIDFFCNPRTAVWTRASGARIRVGYPNKGWRSSLYTHHSRPRTLSAVRFHLASITALGWPAIETTPRLAVRERSETDAALAALGVAAGTPCVGFHPGARWETRRWPPERFADLARRWLAHDSRGIALVTGGPGEEDLVAAVMSGMPAGRARAVVGWPIVRFVALQARCAAFVAGDTGPMHTAVAAGTKVLGLISRNRPAMFFPYSETFGHRAHYARAECSPCDRDRCDDLRCLDRLGVEQAWRLLSEMLTQGTAGGLITLGSGATSAGPGV